MVRVRYFAAAEEAAGRDEEKRAETTLRALRTGLLEDYPALSGILAQCAVLVEGARVDDDTVIQEGQLVDILPPFAGG